MLLLNNSIRILRLPPAAHPLLQIFARIYKRLHSPVSVKRSGSVAPWGAILAPALVCVQADIAKPPPIPPGLCPINAGAARSSAAIFRFRHGLA